MSTQVSPASLLSISRLFTYFIVLNSLALGIHYWGEGTGRKQAAVFCLHYVAYNQGALGDGTSCTRITNHRDIQYCMCLDKSQGVASCRSSPKKSQCQAASWNLMQVLGAGDRWLGSGSVMVSLVCTYYIVLCLALPQYVQS